MDDVSATVLEEALAEATTALERASAHAQVSVRPVTGTGELAAMETLLARVWQHPPGSVEVDVTMLAALARSGNYVAGAFRRGDDEPGDGEELVGATVGFRSEPFPVTLHSHVTGVDTARALPGTGSALKAHQRVWCLQRAITAVRWTVDPLQARNARLNIGRLGADWVGFVPDYYGDLRDGLNADVGSDRLLLQWDLTRLAADRDAERAAAAAATTQGEGTVLARGAAGEPVAGPVPTAYGRLEIPADIDALRATDPDLARQWREALRTLLPGLISSGRRVIDFDEGGAYVVAPGRTHQ